LKNYSEIYIENTKEETIYLIVSSLASLAYNKVVEGDAMEKGD